MPATVLPKYPNITYVEGDLLEAHRTHKCSILVQQVNCIGRWEAGLHRQIGQRWPGVKDAFLRHRWCLGDMQLFPAGDPEFPNLRIADLVGQYGIGNAYVTGRCYTDYHALQAAMTKLAAAVPPEDEVGFAQIGSGLAGGDWTLISKMISQAFDHMVYVFLWPPQGGRSRGKTPGSQSW